MKEILKPKSKALTEKDCYEELARIIKIYCYQAVVREEIEFFRWWVKNVLTQLSEYASSPDEPEKYPAYKAGFECGHGSRERRRSRRSRRTGKGLSDAEGTKKGRLRNGGSGKGKQQLYTNPV